MIHGNQVTFLYTSNSNGLWHEWMEKLHEFAFVFFKNWQLKNLILLMESSNISYFPTF